MALGDLFRYLAIAAVGLIVLIAGLKIVGKRSAEKDVVSELRTLANPTSSFEQEFAEDARKALFRSMVQLHVAETRIGKEPGEILDKVFHGKGDGAIFPVEAGSDRYTDPRESLIRDGLLRNFQKCKSFGLFAESDNRTRMEEGDNPIITRGPATGEAAILHPIIDPAISPGVEKLIPNLVIGPKKRDATPTDLSIKQAKALADSLYAAKLIEDSTRNRIRDAYDKLAEKLAAATTPEGEEAAKE